MPAGSGSLRPAVRAATKSPAAPVSIGHTGIPALPGGHPMAVRTWESALVVIATVMFGTDLADILLAPSGGHPPELHALYFLFYTAFGLLLVTSRDAVLILVTTSPVLVVVLAFPAVSILWSVNPGETLERSVTLLGTSLFGAYLGWRYTLGRIIFLLAAALSIAVCLSMAMIVLVPSIGIEHQGKLAGTWIGVSLHKNALGAVAGLACLAIGYAITDSRGRRRLVFCLTFLVALILLIGSRSISSLLVTAVVGGLALWARYLQRSPNEIPVLSLILVIAMVITGVAVIGADLLERALALFGKNSTLSSRLPLWSLVWSYIEQRFWLGFGYEAFWQPGAVREIEAELYFTPFYAHNGLLETWLNGGLVLVALMLLLLGTILVRSLVLYVRWRDLAISSFPLFYCVYFLMMNFAESYVLARNDLLWALLVAVAVFVAKWVRPRHA
jgi:exopolysaccharide production protein ExoQ